MLQELLSWLPQDAGRSWLTAAVVCAAAGLVLWAAGARVGRSALTLVGVAAGTWAGLRVPQRTGFEFEPMGLACIGALVVGLAGYLLHTVWVGLTLGTLFAGAGVLLTWNKLAGGASWSIPVLDLSAPWHEVLRGVWASLPGGLPRVMPYVVAACFAAGVLVTVITPKLGRVLAFSAFGGLLFSAGGVIAIALARPQWLEYFPAGSGAQGVALTVLVMLGAALQWLMYPRPQKPVNVAPVPARAPAAKAAPSRQPQRERVRRREVNDDLIAAAVRGANVGGMKLTTTEARA